MRASVGAVEAVGESTGEDSKENERQAKKGTWMGVGKERFFRSCFLISLGCLWQASSTARQERWKDATAPSSTGINVSFGVEWLQSVRGVDGQDG